MPRFSTTPPTDPLPRAQPDLPEQANLPEEFALPEVSADRTAHLPEDVGPPDGLPAIPVLEDLERFPPEGLPEEADVGLSHAPWA